MEENSIHLHVSETKSLENWNEKGLPDPELVLVPKFVVNSAGLSAPLLARRFHGLDKRVIPPTFFARGCYFTLSNTKKPPFGHLIYPLPEDGGIGVHVTLDLNGQVKFGPDVEWIDGVDDVSSFLNRYLFLIWISGFTVKSDFLQQSLHHQAVFLVECHSKYHLVI